MHRIRLYLFVGAIATHVVLPAHAQTPWDPTPTPGVIEDRFKMEISLVDMGMSTTLRLDPGAGQLGTSISGENDLGLNSGQWIPQLEFSLFPAQQHLVRLSGFTVRRQSSAVLTRSIVFDDQTYTAGQTVQSVLNLSMLGFTYGYRLFHSERYDLTPTVELRVVAAEANVYVPAVIEREADSGAVILPLLGLEGHWAVTRRWLIDLRGQFLSTTQQGVGVHVTNLKLGARWQFNPHVSLGLAYHSQDLKVESIDNSTAGLVKLSFKGPALSVQAGL